MKEFSKENMKQSLLKNPRIKKLFEKYEDEFNENNPYFIPRIIHELQNSRTKPFFSDFFFEERPAVQRVHFFVAVCVLGAVSTALIPTGFWGVSVGTVLMLCAAVIEAALALVSMVRYMIAKNEYQEIKKSVALIQEYRQDWNKLCLPETDPLTRSHVSYRAAGRFFGEPRVSPVGASTAEAGLGPVFGETDDHGGFEQGPYVGGVAPDISALQRPISYNHWLVPTQLGTVELDYLVQAPPRASAAAAALGDSQMTSASSSHEAHNYRHSLWLPRPLTSNVSDDLAPPLEDVSGNPLASW